MSMIDTAVRRIQVPSGVEIPGTVRDALQAEISKYAWAWFREHTADVIVTRKVWFWTVNITVRDLREVFVALFGQQPQA